MKWTGEYHIAGVLLDRTDLQQGQHPWMQEVRKDVDGQRVFVREADTQSCTPDTLEIVTGDVPGETVGVAACKLDATEQDAWVKFRVQFYNAAPYDGDWTVKLWAKAVSGEPELTVRPTVPGTREILKPGGEWKHYTVPLSLPAPQDPDANPIFMLELNVDGGAVLIDEVQAWKAGDGTNPTPFRDELVGVFQELRPGSVRYLRNNRDTVLNAIQPRIRNYSRRSLNRRRDDFGTHEFNQFCAHIGADPWANLSGTVLPEDVDQFMAYHGAPADQGLGKLRAELGQAKPWTEVFDQIHVQFGNEVITFSGTGYWGPDYWQALVERAKASPYYDPDVFVFHLNEQGGGRGLLDLHPAFDRFTINGYHIFGVYEDQVERAGDLPGFYDWVFASAWHMWMVPDNSKNYPNLAAAREHGKEISIYEGGNYHSTFSDPAHAPMERINRMNAGRAGGMSATHTMLLLLKHWGGRTQQSFNLSQERFSPAGSFGNLPGAIRGWGGVLRIGNPAERRFRPRFLALKMANQVIGGDLVKTVHSGPDPMFTVTNRFGAGYGPSRNPEEMVVGPVPRIHSYGFGDGGRRGLILVSNDPRDALPVQVAFEGAVRDGLATCWTLVSEHLEDTNEHDWAPDGPEVSLEQRTLSGFQSGYRLSLPPATMMALEWEAR